jgi:hypothetical protein
MCQGMRLLQEIILTQPRRYRHERFPGAAYLDPAVRVPNSDSPHSSSSGTFSCTPSPERGRIMTQSTSIPVEASASSLPTLEIGHRSTSFGCQIPDQ